MASAAADNERIAKLQFHYIKSPEYRETACHGALGGVTPQRKIWMALFSERAAIPRMVEFEIAAPEGEESVEFNESAAVPAHVDQRHGIIRHVELTTYMDLDVATRLHNWLGQRIAELQRAEKAQEAKAG
jgi:hypothetical protein